VNRKFAWIENLFHGAVKTNWTNASLKASKMARKVWKLPLCDRGHFIYCACNEKIAIKNGKCMPLLQEAIDHPTHQEAQSCA
jgi:hypothetical protein